MSLDRVCVAGATGRQGGAVARELINRGYPVRALTRSPTSNRARELAALGAEVVHAELTDVDQVHRVAKDCQTFFGVTVPVRPNFDDTESRQGAAMVTAAETAGIDFFVLASAPYTPTLNFTYKSQTEKLLAKSSMPSAVYAPVNFMENLLRPLHLPDLRRGLFTMHRSADSPIEYISLSNIGQFVGHMVANGADFAGRRVEIAADLVTGPRVAEILSDASGRDIVFKSLPFEDEDFEDRRKGYEYQDQVGFNVDPVTLQLAYPEVEWDSLEQWASRQDWDHLLT